MQISNYTIQTLSLLKVDFTEYMYRIYPFSDCLPNKNYKTYCRRARVQVWTILNDFEVFELYWTLFSFYLCLFWTISFYLWLSWTISDNLGPSQPSSGYSAISGCLELYWAISGYIWLSLAVSFYVVLSLAISIKYQVSGCK